MICVIVDVERIHFLVEKVLIFLMIDYDHVIVSVMLQLQSMNWLLLSGQMWIRSNFKILIFTWHMNVFPFQQRVIIDREKIAATQFPYDSWWTLAAAEVSQRYLEYLADDTFRIPVERSATFVTFDKLAGSTDSSWVDDDMFVHREMAYYVPMSPRDTLFHASMYVTLLCMCYCRSAKYEEEKSFNLEV